MINLYQALELIDGRREFVVKEYDDLVCINYVCQLSDSFEGLRQNFRGIHFDAKSGNVISLPLHKFFNVGQTEALHYDKIKHLSGKVYEKLDGSFVQAYLHPNGELKFGTRFGHNTEQALLAKKLAEEKPKFVAKIVDEINSGFTPCFELVGRNNTIVIDYPQSRLVYLISRNRQTGEYVLNDEFEDKAQNYTYSLAQLKAMAETAVGCEGWVIHLENGQWCKLKTKWYLERHRVVDFLMAPKWKLFRAVYDDVMDDILANVAEQYRPRLKEIYNEAQLDFLTEKQRIVDKFKRIVDELFPGVAYLGSKREYRKPFAVATNLDPDFSCLIKLFDYKSIDRDVQKRLLKRYEEMYPNKFLSCLSEE